MLSKQNMYQFELWRSETSSAKQKVTLMWPQSLDKQGGLVRGGLL